MLMAPRYNRRRIGYPAALGLHLLSFSVVGATVKNAQKGNNPGKTSILHAR